jgi:hypothetical protein
MMEAVKVSKTLDTNSVLIWMIAQEDLIAGFIYTAVIHIHPSKCSSVRHTLVLDLTFFINIYFMGK